MSPKWSKTLRLAILVPLGPLWTKPAMFGHFWSTMEHFWAIPSHERLAPKQKQAHQRSPMCGLFVEPQNVLLGTYISLLKNVKIGQNYMKKLPFCLSLAMNGKLWVRKKFDTHV